MAAIEVQDLHFSYPSWAQHPLPPSEAPSPVLRGVNLCVERGEFLAVMGPTGAGKSTLCMALNGLVPQATGGVIRGRVEVLGHEARRTPVAQMATHVGLVAQDPDTQLISASVEEEVAFGPGNLGLDHHELVERVDWALDVVGLSAHRQRSPTQLSGGQKQRVAIASALAMLPQVLILDEPTAMLDPVGQSEVFAVVERLCGERGMTLLMVTQDAERVAQFADRLAILHAGRIICHDEPLRVFEDMCKEGAGQLGVEYDASCPAPGVATPQVVELAVALNEAHGTSFHLAHLDEAEVALRPWLAHRLAPEAPSRRSPDESLVLPSPPPGDLREGARDIAIRFDGVRFYYGEADVGDDTFEALNGVTLDVADGAYLAVVGQNGSGKTTLVKQINGLLKPTSGRVTVYGVDTRTATVGRLAHTVGYAFQNPDHQIFCATTREEIAFGPRNLGLSDDEVRARTEETLAAFGLTALADAPPAVLGHGLRRKVAVASVVAMRPRVLILDEPTAGLDRRSADELMALVDRLHDEGHTILVVTHDMRLVADHCSEMLVMHGGLVLDYDLTRQVFQHEAVLTRAQLLAPQITRLAGRLADMGIPGDILSVGEFCAALPSSGSPDEVDEKATDPSGDLWEGTFGRGRA